MVNYASFTKHYFTANYFLYQLKESLSCGILQKFIISLFISYVFDVKLFM